MAKSQDGFLPIIRLGARPEGFAGLISDTSLLDVETLVIDKNAGGTADGLLFRSGTVAVLTSVNAKSGTRRGKPAVKADADATPAKRFVGIAFSHDNTDQMGEIYSRSPATGAIVGVRPANGVNTGRMWLFLNGAIPAAFDPVGVADIPSSSTFDKTKPFVNGAVTKGVTTSGSENLIQGWQFTGHFAVDPATGYNIAEVEIKRA